MAIHDFRLGGLGIWNMGGVRGGHRTYSRFCGLMSIPGAMARLIARIALVLGFLQVFKESFVFCRKCGAGTK